MSRNKVWLGVVGLGLAALLLGRPASAYTIDPAGCGTCDGLGITITYVDSGDGLKFNFTFEADFTTAAWEGETMDAFSIQFGGGSSTALDKTDMSAPSSAPTGTWTRVYDKVSGNGCESPLMEGSVCFTVNPTGEGGDGAQIIGGAGSKYTWTFTVTFSSTAEATAALEKDYNSIKFLSLKGQEQCTGNPKVCEINWSTGHQLSEGAGLGDDDDDEDLPEPGTLALLGLGLLGLAATRRRRAA